MQKHDHFEELCALAAVGQLAPEEHMEFAAHLGSCAVCRATVHEMAVITDSWIPATSSIGQSASAKRPSPTLRSKFIAQARSRGINLTWQSDRQPSRWLEWPFNLVRPYAVAGALVAVMIGAAAIFMQLDRSNLRSRGETHSLEARINDLRTENMNLRERSVRAEGQASEQQQRYAAQLAELQQLRQQRDSAVDKLISLEQKVALNSAPQTELQQQQLGAAHAQLAHVSENYTAVARDLAATRAELDSAHATNVEDRALIAAQQKELQELAQRPAVEKAALEHERELLAADRDIRELMGARNLHIIDVHDRDSKGKAQRSFGRVFYTEGKSLIFYAYDLSSPKVKNASFQAWGHKEDGSKDAVSLGLFYMDDQSHSRWVLRFSDPAVLAAIDSVFVTVESPGGGKKPSGEKLLYAFLNFDANHP